MANWKQLAEPFEPSDIEWRVQQSGMKGDNPYAMVLAYVTNRAIQQRLDDVCSPENWRNEYAAAPDGGVMCGISIKCGDEWVTKWDGAENTDIEAVKGGLSNSMKRAAVQWGIGRYLYKLETTFVQLNKAKTGDYTEYLSIKDKYAKPPKVLWTGYWSVPKLPAWALPSEDEPVDKAEKPPKAATKPVEPPKVETGLIHPTLMTELRNKLRDAGMTGDNATAFVESRIGKPAPVTNKDVQDVIEGLDILLSEEAKDIEEQA